MSTLKQLTEKQLEIWKNYSKQGTHPWNADVAIQDLSYQVGSLAKLNLQLKNYRFRHGLTDETLKITVADELVDILAILLFVADEYGIDLDKSFNDMLDSDVRKITERSSQLETA
jgi:NTP pyrophosphatase (non-canonical NTP hydrolase)